MGEHDWGALRRIAATERSPAALGPFMAWQCEYDGPDGRYGIVLHGTDPELVWLANRKRLPGLQIVGVHWETDKHGGKDG